MTQHDLVSRAVEDDGSLSPHALVERYAEGAAEVARAVEGLRPEQVRARPVEGRWSVLEVVCHLADTEQLFADRIKRTLAFERPLLLGVDAGAMAVPLGYQARDLDEELRAIAVTRSQLAGILRRAPDAAWARTAVHSELGLLTLRQLVLHAVFHVRHHLAFVAEKRAALEVDGTEVARPDPHDVPPSEAARTGPGDEVADALERARARFREGRYDEALDTLARIPPPLHEGAALRVLRAEVHKAKGDHARAAWAYRRAAADPASPLGPSLWYAAGVEHLQAGEAGAASACFRAAVERGYAGPGDQGALSSEAMAAQAEGRLAAGSYAAFARGELMASSLRALERDPEPTDAADLDERERRATVLVDELEARVPPEPVREVHEAVLSGLAECVAGLGELRAGRVAEGWRRWREGRARLAP